jgi:hypothetical protein
MRTLADPHWRALVPALVPLVLMIVWAAHNGGYDSDTWYWGALVTLGALAATVVSRGGWRQIMLSRYARLALFAFAAYVAWSYASIAWAQSPGDALQGSNRALLYLLVFTLLLVLPWTAEAALIALVTFALAIGVIGLVILFRLASQDHVTQLVIAGRLAAPTGYFNSSVSLFMTGALLAIVLGSRRELPGLLRGLLLAMAAAGLQMALIGQSRGWLFTLPLVVLVTLLVVRDRLRVAAAALLPVMAALIPVHRLVGVSHGAITANLNHAAGRAGTVALMLCAATFVVGTLLAWAEVVARPRSLSGRRRRLIGVGLATLTLLAGVAGATAATHGDPLHFISRQWRGFSHPAVYTNAQASNFATVGSGRYDFWRVSLDAALAHPVGGLGQDNFADYYVTRRRTDEEPAWTHSLEMRLLAHTGFVGFALFTAFLVTGLLAASVARRRGSPLASAVAGAAVLPLVVWVIHGSVDWFWEFPALSGPALGFLAVAMALGSKDRIARPRPLVPFADRIPRGAGVVVGGLALIVLVVVLAFPYLSVREVSIASDLRQRNPRTALHDLATAASLNPLSAVPGRLAGTIALQTGNFTEAETRFRQAIDREPGGWYGWLGDGLAASALGDSARAAHDYAVAAAINSHTSVIKAALKRVNTTHPLTPSAALGMLVVVS